MSDTDSSSTDEEDREYHAREREKWRQCKPWEKRTKKWGSSPSNCSADELLAIGEFYKKTRFELEWGCSLNKNVPAKELEKILDWWYTDKSKRESLNAILEVYERCPWTKKYEFGDKVIGPEYILLKDWWELEPEKRALCLKHGRVCAGAVWDAIYKHNVVPIKDMSWDALYELGDVIAKYSK